MNQQYSIAAGDTKPTMNATCPAGYILTGGGYSTSINVKVLSNLPVTTGSTWTVTAHNDDGVTRTLTVYAVCIK